MNLMGKILTFLILMLSICFLVVAVMVGASHQKWKEAAISSKEKASVAQSRLDAARTQSGEKEKRLAAEKFSRAMQLAQLESQLKLARENYESKEAQLRKETEISQGLVAELERSEKRLAQQDKEVADLKGRNSKLVDEIADKFAMVQNLTTQKFELTNRLDAVEELRNDLSENLAIKEKIMKVNGLDDNDLIKDIVPRLDALVIQTNDNAELIAVSAGTDDGLRTGHVLDIHRGERYIGKIKITRAEHDIAVGETIKDFMQDRVKEGDHVTSKF